MRNPLRRFYGRGDLHFVTFSCYRRRREDPRVTPARGAPTRPLEADGEVNSPLQRFRSYRGAPAHHRKLTGLTDPCRFYLRLVARAAHRELRAEWAVNRLATGLLRNSLHPKSHCKI